MDIPVRLGCIWSQTSSKNRKCFYFHNASQISAMVGVHSQQIKTQICTVGNVGDSFSSLPIPSIASLKFPTSTNKNLSPMITSNLGQSGDFPISRQNLGRSRNSEIPDRLGFSRHTKTRHIVYNNLGCV